MTQTIGQRLKAEREEQRLTLEKVFEATRIRVQYLQALEADELSRMPSPVQARGYLRNYAEFLGLDFEEILEEMRALNAQPAPAEVVGPEDEVPPAPPQDNGSAEAQPEIAAREIQAIPQDEPVVEEFPLPVKPKPTRRKKTDLSPSSASAEPTTRRRGRKKAEPEALPVVALEAVPEPEPTDESAAPPAQEIPQTEPVFEESAKQPEEPQPESAGDTLWHTWLNRVSSILAARARRRALIPREVSIVENEPAVVPDEPEVGTETTVESPSETLSNVIFKEIGHELRERRELLSLHLDEVERNTHVKAHYLDALERGALDELPSMVQTRGMLSNYATFLDLDVDVLLLRFADALQARHRERNPQKPARKPGQPIIANMPPVRSFIAGDMIFGVGMVVLLVGFAIWGVSRVMTIQSQQEVEPTAPSISDVLLSSPDPSSFTATPTFVPVEAFPGEPTVTVEIPTQNVNAEVQLNLVAVERTYMRVVVDGEVAFDGRVVPGNAYPFEAETQIEVLVGSGAAIRTVYNGRDLGLMGTFGQVVNNIYLGTEIITPTALPSLTPTITVTPTRTAVPTSTSPSTNTPVPSSTAVP